MHKCLSFSLLSLLVTSLGHAGTYGPQAYNFPDGTIAFGDGSTLSFSTAAAGQVTGNTSADATKPYLRMANKSNGGSNTALRFPELDPGAAIQSFDASLITRMEKSSASAVPGSGWALSFGAVPATGFGNGPLGFAMPGGLVISFDTRLTANDTPAIRVYCSNVEVGSFLSSNLTEKPAVTSGTFKLTNPVTGATSGPISYSWSASLVQIYMRQVSGWNAVTVTGPAGGPWVVNHGVVGSYADPVGDGALLTGPSLTPGQGVVTVANTQDGNAGQNEIWQISAGGRGFVFDTTFRAVSIHWDYDGLDLTYKGQVIFTDLPTPGFTPSVGNTFALTASTSGGGQDTFVDNISISSSPAAPPDFGGPIISEFMAENKETMEDEDMDTPDWIEIYNGQNAPANLAGWKLTDGVQTWVFPSVNMAAYGHVVVYASGKNRTANPALLHTNFTLPKTGGVLTLKNPADAVVSTYTYPNQIEDVSYGTKYQGGDVGFLDPISPGTPTLYYTVVAPNGPAEDVVWSRGGGLISGSTPVSVTAPVAPGSVVRYTTGNTVPNEGSAVFAGPVNVSASTVLRARVYTPGYLPGKVSTRGFLLLDASMTNYNGSGQPFKSHLPVVVLDSFGVNVDGTTDQAQARPHRFTYGAVIDRDVTGWASVTSPVYDFEGRSGTHVRGDSSGGFAQKSYAWETWNNEDEDKDVPLLGMPAESDWVLYGPFTDKTFIRNIIAYSKVRELNGGKDGYGMRTRLCEVFYNQGKDQPVSYDDYRGVYVLIERIKVDKDRVDIAKLNELVTDPALITGGYIFRRDRTSADGNTPLPVGMHSHTPNILNAAQTTYLTNYLNAFNNALNGANFTDPVLGYAPYIDRDSFIDNWWFVEICKQIDGYRLSTYFYKDRGDAKIHATPIWDYNLSLGNADYLAGDQPTGWYWNQTDSYWWVRLRQDPNYETRNWDRYWEMRRGIFSTASINAYVDQLASEALNGSTTPVTNNMSLAAGQPSTLENAVMRHYRKYQVLGTYLWPNGVGYASRIYYNSNGNATTGEIDWMKNWLEQRLLWIDNQYTFGSAIFRPPNFSNYGGNVPSGTQLTITPYTGTPPGGFSFATGTIYYTTDGTDPRTTTTGGVAETDLISGNGDACKWLVPSAGNGGTTLTAGAGAQQWTNFTDPPNIANWTTATTGIGYANDNDANYLNLIGAGSNTGAQMFNINATCYVRVAFNIPDAATLANIGTLRLHLKYEDGHRTYLNGVQVAGSNDTHASMTTNPATANATIARDEAAAVSYETTDISGTGIPALRVGLNVLAVHCLNGVDATSSDLLMVPKLTYLPPGSGGTGGIAYTGPITLTGSTTINARLFSNGNWSPITTGTYIVNAQPPSAANLTITEVHYNPADPTLAEQALGFTSASDFEYIELQNVSAGSVDLSGMRVEDAVSFDFSTVSDPDILTLTPGERIILVGNSAAFLHRNPGVTEIAGEFGGNLANGGELLTVRDVSGGIIAQFTWGVTGDWPEAADGAGYSLVLNNPGPNANYASGGNWRSSAAIGGSPGESNSVPFSGSPGGDTDKDQFSDFLEHALGSDSQNPASTFQPTISVESHLVGGLPGNYVTFRFRRNLAADGVIFTPQLCATVGGWDTAPLPLTFVSSVNNGDGTSTETWRSTAVWGPGSGFARLLVSPTP